MIDSSNKDAKKTVVAFTLIELLVVIAVIAILAGILFPIVAKTIDRAHQTACISNLKQIGIGYRLYMQDYDGMRPIQIDRLTPQYVKSPQIYICQSDPTKDYANHSFETHPEGSIYPCSYYETLGWSKKSWDFLEERQSRSGYVFDVLHGTKHPIQYDNSAPSFIGLTLRLNMDGSVVSRNIVYANNAQFDIWTLANYNPGEPLPDNILLK